MTSLTRTAVTTSRAALTDPAHQAFLALRTTFVVAPILFGLAVKYAPARRGDDGGYRA